MKNKLFLIALIILSSCSSTRFIDSWKNREITGFNPKKLLVIGMTDNLTARKIFEEELQLALLQRNINAKGSGSVLEKSFTETKKNEAEIDAMVGKLAKEGFDAILITTVRGVDEKSNYAPGYYTVDYRWTRFGRYYYRYQDVYYTPNYYSDYKVYHLETSIYNITEDDTKALVWVGSFDVVNPQTITATVKDYVAKIIDRLEKENVIKKI
tara:strand:+ start:85528 stop:86160 length:633 start_codon:yes stop_codon:yes gene_type:complete